jgi:hypothetical protein
MTVGEIIDTQNVIISAQARVISELFSILGQYMAAEEMDGLPAVIEINRIAGLQHNLDREP